MAEATFTKIKAGAGGGGTELTIGGKVYARHIDDVAVYEYHTDQQSAAKTLPAGAYYVEVIEQGSSTVTVNNTTVPADGIYTDGDKTSTDVILDEVVIGTGTYQVIVIYKRFDPVE